MTPLVDDPYRSVLEGMLAAFTVSEGIIKLTGPVGCDKSLVCAALFQALRAQGTEVVYFLAAPRSVEALQNGIVEPLQLDATRNFTRTLTQYLCSRKAPYQHLVLIVDDAQDMDEPTFMAVRMLCNIQSHNRERVRVVLSGSPELDARLFQPVYRSLAQHIGQSFSLAPGMTPDTQPAEPSVRDAGDAVPSPRRLPLASIVLGLCAAAAIWLAWPAALPPSQVLAVADQPASPPLIPVVSMNAVPPSDIAITPEPSAEAEATSSPQDLPQELERMLTGWLTSWQRRALDDYLEYYAPDFIPAQALSRAQWQEQRVQNIGRADGIALDYSDLVVVPLDAEHAMLRFWLHYRSNDYDDDTLKELTLVRQATGDWRIADERNLEVNRLR